MGVIRWLALATNHVNKSYEGVARKNRRGATSAEKILPSKKPPPLPNAARQGLLFPRIPDREGERESERERESSTAFHQRVASLDAMRQDWTITELTATR